MIARWFTVFYVVVMSGWSSAGGDAGEREANRLIREKSPYLLQHARNPVDWYPWGEEAFEKARKENRPILLSIGYSTCHWCHVMERESFESEAVARFLNAHFVAVKLDREERPDVDGVYMKAFQAMSQEGGGWPLNMFLTPELKPFYGGTYFPPERRGGRPGFLEVLKSLERLWREKEEEVRTNANESHRRMKEFFEENGGEPGELSSKLAAKAAGVIAVEGDLRAGGWGEGPKFPQPSHLRFLFRCGSEVDRKSALMTCRKMMWGGMHDQLAGGFHRYAVDGGWVVPHFEKMLYDQAQLVDVYVDAWLLSGDDEFRRVACATADYVLKDLRHERGGFFSAQDAQSEGKEGKSYCWTEEELRSLLPETQFALVKRYFGVTADGNFLDHSDPDALRGQNVLFVAEPDWKPGAAEQRELEAAVEAMRTARSRRVPPATDDKVLASWNGLMIAALARAGRVLNEPRYIRAAEEAHAFLRAALWDPEKSILSHRWRDGARDASQQAESYLYLLRGSRRLYEVTLKEEYLEFALALAEGARERFGDEEDGGFFDGEERDDLVLRLKGDFDSATPTAGSVGAMEFAKLGEMTGRGDLREFARKAMMAVAGGLAKSPFSMPEMLRAVDFETGRPSRLVLTAGEGREAMLRAAWGAYRRNFVVVGTTGPLDDFTRGLEGRDGRATAYLCLGQECRLPVTDAGKLEALFDGGEADADGGSSFGLRVPPGPLLTPRDE